MMDDTPMRMLGNVGHKFLTAEVQTDFFMPTKV